MAVVSLKSAHKYSRSLFELCSPNELDLISGQLKILPGLFAPHGTLIESLNNPRYPLVQKISALDAILAKAHVTDTRVINLVKTLTESRRFSMLPVIIEQFEKIVQALKNQLSVTLTAAFQPDQHEIDQIKDTLAKNFGGAASINVHINPALIGGLMVTIDDKIFDGSIAGALEKIGQELGK